LESSEPFGSTSLESTHDLIGHTRHMRLHRLEPGLETGVKTLHDRLTVRLKQLTVILDRTLVRLDPASDAGDETLNSTPRRLKPVEETVHNRATSTHQ